MFHRRKYFPILLVAAYCLGYATAQTGNKKVDDRIKELFPSLLKNPAEGTTAAPQGQVDADGDLCECVNYYLCNGSHININGEGLIDVRQSASQCDSYLEFCCKLPKIVNQTIVPTTFTTPKNPDAGCGWRNPDGAGFRTKGDINGEAKFGEFPWMVAILREEPMNLKILSVYQCGGSLIHPKAIITAAHCVSNRERTYIIRAGEWDTQTTRELLPYQNRKVQSITIHKDYYSGALYNDIALVILESPFELNEHIKVACLPTQGAVMPDTTRCWASGWGKNKFGAVGEYQVILKKLNLPLVDRSKCENSLRSTRLGRNFRLHDSFVCAGGEPGIDMCQGDGGSPLVCPIPGENERYQQVGIVAWGIGCGENGVPGVYGNVAMFRNWVDQEMAKNGLGTIDYKY